MNIKIQDLQNKATLSLPPIKKIAQIVLNKERISTCDLSICFISSQKIKALNKKYLGRSYVTDVLAFDLEDEWSGITTSSRKKSIVGEIFISVETAKRNAKEFETDLSGELALYVIHGILHLCGYDDHKPSDIKKMRQREQVMMKEIGQLSKKLIRRTKTQ